MTSLNLEPSLSEPPFYFLPPYIFTPHCVDPPRWNNHIHLSYFLPSSFRTDPHSFTSLSQTLPLPFPLPHHHKHSLTTIPSTHHLVQSVLKLFFSSPMSRVSVTPTKLTIANSRTPCTTTNPPCKYTLTTKSVVTTSSIYNTTFQVSTFRAIDLARILLATCCN